MEQTVDVTLYMIQQHRRLKGAHDEDGKHHHREDQVPEAYCKISIVLHAQHYAYCRMQQQLYIPPKQYFQLILSSSWTGSADRCEREREMLSTTRGWQGVHRMATAFVSLVYECQVCNLRTSGSSEQAKVGF